MNKALVASTLLVLSVSAAPVFASDDPATNTVLIPVRLASFGVGTVVGTPIAIVRHSMSNISKHYSAIVDKVGGKDNVLSALVAAPTAIVSGTAVGTAQGLVDGPKNSVDNCVEKPFSAEAMSLTEKE